MVKQHIPFSDLRRMHKEIEASLCKASAHVIKEGNYILGKEVAIFEREFARFCHSRFAAGVSSGTAALFLALASLKIKEGDEVILPSFTYIATALAVSYLGAKPVFVDINEDDYTIDIEKIPSAITKRTKAIIPVHLYGQCARMQEILAIAKRFGLKVVEDAAQAHGASIKMDNGVWHLAGALSDAGCFSFYPAKNLGALGDGGIVVTDDEQTYRNLLKLRDYGRVSRYEHELIGYNSRLDTLQAAFLSIKLKKLNSWNAMRRKVAGYYSALLKDVKGVKVPYERLDARHVYHVYVIRAKRRDDMLQKLSDRGIGVLIHYPVALHLQKAYAFLGYHSGDFPVAERVAQEVLSLPMHPFISKAQVKLVCAAIREIAGGW